MNKRLFPILLTLSVVAVPIFADSLQERTEALHAEAKEHKHPNLTQDSHPVLYGMVKNLTTKANIPMPRYITTHGAEY